MTWEQEQMEAEERGRKEGREEGLKEGLKEGREEGRKEGETEKALTIAHNMKAEGDSLDKIMRVTGLTAEEIANA